MVGGVLVGGIQVWMREKSYVFTPEDLASITTDALNETRTRYVNGRGSFTTVHGSSGGGAWEAQQLLVG